MRQRFFCNIYGKINPGYTKQKYKLIQHSKNNNSNKETTAISYFDCFEDCLSCIQQFISEDGFKMQSIDSQFLKDGESITLFSSVINKNEITITHYIILNSEEN